MFGAVLCCSTLVIAGISSSRQFPSLMRANDAARNLLAESLPFPAPLVELVLSYFALQPDDRVRALNQMINSDLVGKS